MKLKTIETFGTPEEFDEEVNYFIQLKDVKDIKTFVHIQEDPEDGNFYTYMAFITYDE